MKEELQYKLVETITSIQAATNNPLANVTKSEDLSSYGAQLLEEDGRRVLSYWPYCSKCRKPFEFEKDAPFASCGCPGTTEWGDPRPASWVQPPAPNARLEIDGLHARVQELELERDTQDAHDKLANADRALRAQPGAAYAELPALFREALAWGMTYGPEIPAHQWDEMRESMVKHYTDRAFRGQAPALDCHHRPPCDECAAYDAQGGK